jgi:hypothetical protein
MSILLTTLYAEYTYRQKSLTLFEREYSWAFSREQRNNAGQQIWERIFEIRTRIEERLNREERAPSRHPPFPNLVPRRWFRGAPPRPFLRNRIAPLRPRESLRLPTRYREDYTRH